MSKHISRHEHAQNHINCGKTSAALTYCYSAAVTPRGLGSARIRSAGKGISPQPVGLARGPKGQDLQKACFDLDGSRCPIVVLSTRAAQCQLAASIWKCDPEGMYHHAGCAVAGTSWCTVFRCKCTARTMFSKLETTSFNQAWPQQVGPLCISLRFTTAWPPRQKRSSPGSGAPRGGKSSEGR